MKQFSYGRLLAFLFSAFVVFMCWGMVFAPGGSGSNVVLGLLVAIFGVYYVTIHLGNTLDDHIFHGGNKERALAVRRARKLLADARDKMRPFVAKAKKKGTLVGPVLEACEAAMKELDEAIKAKAQLSVLKEKTEASHDALSRLLGKPVQESFLSGAGSLVLALAAALALRAFIVEPYQIPSGSMIPTLLVGDHLFVSKLNYGIPNPFASQPSYFVRWSNPKPGQVVVFQAPDYVPRHAGESWIKRVIAGPGQTVRLSDTMIYVDGKPYPYVSKPEELKYLDYHDVGNINGFMREGPEGIWTEEDAVYVKEQIGDVVHDIYLHPPMQRYPFESEWPMPMQKKLTGLDCNENSCKVEDGYIFVMGDNRGNSSDGRIWGALPIDNVKGRALAIWMSVDGSRKSLDLGRFTLPGFRWERWFKAIH